VADRHGTPLRGRLAKFNRHIEPEELRQIWSAQRASGTPKNRLRRDRAMYARCVEVGQPRKSAQALAMVGSVS
jgi:hypothetical protein